jgi:hypothetical protein
MPIAAIPEYLSRHELADARPGLRFAMYLSIRPRQRPARPGLHPQFRERLLAEAERL